MELRRQFSISSGMGAYLAIRRVRMMNVRYASSGEHTIMCGVARQNGDLGAGKRFDDSDKDGTCL